MATNYTLPADNSRQIPHIVPIYQPLIDRSHSFEYFDPAASCCQKFASYPVQICYNYDRQRYCQYGASCMFFHVNRMHHRPFKVNSPRTELWKHDHQCLKRIRMELVDLLRYRRGIPVSTCSLPIFYHDMYWKELHLGEYSLDQVLARTKKCALVSDRYSSRPHGQPSVILVDDIHRYETFMAVCVEYPCQVYLTFRPQSMLTHEDVRIYFNYFGEVLNVDIPNREPRMFGCVTFLYPETATLVLTKTYPHVIRQVQVEVNAYLPRAARAR